MIYKIEVRPGKNTEKFQYYTETVEAPTRGDAISRVQRANPGCNVECVNFYNAEEAPNKSGGSGSSMDLETTTGLVVVGGGLLAFFMFMPWILMGAGGAAGAWLGEKLTGFNVMETDLDTKNDEHMKKFGTILALSLLLGGIGFTTGHNFTNSSNSVDSVEEVRN